MSWWRWWIPYFVVFAIAVLSAAGALWIALRQAAGSRELLDQITGGESFVYLEPLRQSLAVRYFIRHAGDHPTYDVVLRVQEIVVVDGKRKRRLIFGPTEHGRTLKLGSGFDWTYPDPMPPAYREWPLIFSEPPIEGAVERSFRIEMMARNGIFIQRLRVWPVGERWHSDSKVVFGRAGAGLLTLPAFDEAQKQGITPEGRLEDDTEDFR